MPKPVLYIASGALGLVLVITALTYASLIIVMHDGEATIATMENLTAMAQTAMYTLVGVFGIHQIATAVVNRPSSSSSDSTTTTSTGSAV